MNYGEAKIVVDENKTLIGKRHPKGGVIDDVVIYPTNEVSYQEFIEIYTRTLDPELSIKKFIDEDVDVFCIIDKSRIRSQGVFGHSSLKGSMVE